MKTTLGTDVDLAPGHIVLDGVSAPHERGTAAPRRFGPCLLWPRSPISATAELLLWCYGQHRSIALYFVSINGLLHGLAVDAVLGQLSKHVKMILRVISSVQLTVGSCKHLDNCWFSCWISDVFISGYWESLLQQLKAHMARTRLRERHQDELRRKLFRLKQEARLPFITWEIIAFPSSTPFIIEPLCLTIPNFLIYNPLLWNYSVNFCYFYLVICRT